MCSSCGPEAAVNTMRADAGLEKAPNALPQALTNLNNTVADLRDQVFSLLNDIQPILRPEDSTGEKMVTEDRGSDSEVVRFVKEIDEQVYALRLVVGAHRNRVEC